MGIDNLLTGVVNVLENAARKARGYRDDYVAKHGAKSVVEGQTGYTLSPTLEETVVKSQVEPLSVTKLLIEVEKQREIASRYALEAKKIIDYKDGTYAVLADGNLTNIGNATDDITNENSGLVIRYYTSSDSSDYQKSILTVMYHGKILLTEVKEDHKTSITSYHPNTKAQDIISSVAKEIRQKEDDEYKRRQNESYAALRENFGLN